MIELFFSGERCGPWASCFHIEWLCVPNFKCQSWSTTISNYTRSQIIANYTSQIMSFLLTWTQNSSLISFVYSSVNQFVRFFCKDLDFISRNAGPISNKLGTILHLIKSIQVGHTLPKERGGGRIKFIDDLEHVQDH